MKITLTFILVFAILQIFAQTQSPIDTELDKCLETNFSTQGMLGCITKATESWDKELNKNYQDLKAKLPESQHQTLKIAQMQWAKYRDSEIQLLYKVYSKLDGTMWKPIIASRKMEITQQRALELANYTSDLEIDE